MIQRRSYRDPRNPDGIIWVVEDKRRRRRYSYRKRQKNGLAGIHLSTEMNQPGLKQPDASNSQTAVQTPEKKFSQEDMSTTSSSSGYGCYEEIRENVMVWLQTTATDEFLNRHTYTLAAEYLDEYFAGEQLNFDSDQLQALAAASLSLAVKLEEIYRVKLERLSYIASVEKSFIINKEVDIAKKLQYRLRRNTYSMVLDEMLDRWDGSQLNIFKESFFENDQQSYQRYRNIYHIADRLNMTERAKNLEGWAGVCLMKVLGDTEHVRAFTGYRGPPISKQPLQHFPSHPNSEHNLKYTEYLRLQTSTT